MGDDGVGVRVVEALRREGCGRGVDLVDGGTLGLDLLFAIEMYGRAILVDAADMGAPPGTVRTLATSDLAEVAPAGDAHGVSVADALELAQATGACPSDVVLIGIQPEQVGPSERLSSSVEDAIPAAVAQVRQQVCGPGLGE